VAEWLKAAVSKTVNGGFVVRGFESLPLRSCRRKACKSFLVMLARVTGRKPHRASCGAHRCPAGCPAEPHFKSALVAAGVREVRFRDLRHTFGTRMAAAGVPMCTLKEWLGHRDFATTLVCADYPPSSREADLVDEAFSGATQRVESVVVATA
jgi:Phage integrase family